MNTPRVTAQLSIVTTLGILGSLAALHILSPEFDPSWRMVSEYAYGQYGWVLSLMFLAWAGSSFSLAYSLLPYLQTRLGKIGLGLLGLSGVGELMAAFFDINHSLHGLSALLGIGSFVLAAPLISRELRRNKSLASAHNTLLLIANLPWISASLMIGSFALLISTYMQSGGDLSAGPVSEIPPGVIAVVGWANRFLIVVYAISLAYLASLTLKSTKKK